MHKLFVSYQIAYYQNLFEKTETKVTVRPGNKNRRSKSLKKAEENGL